MTSGAFSLVFLCETLCPLWFAFLQAITTEDTEVHRAVRIKRELAIVAASAAVIVGQTWVVAVDFRFFLRCQLLQNLFPQLLRFPEKFLIVKTEPVQLQRAVRREALAQNHIAHANGIGQNGLFAEFFKGSCGIVMIHAEIVVQASGVRHQASGKVSIEGSKAKAAAQSRKPKP